MRGYFAMLFTLQESRRTSTLVLEWVRGYMFCSFIFFALVLKPFDLCKLRVFSRVLYNSSQ
jgi:hypothetical protein